MTISVSQSFINVTKTHFKNEYRREINNDEIFHKIFELLIFDQKIDNQILYANINWEIIDDKFQGVYIPKDNEVIYFTQILNPINNVPKSRNTFLAQNYYPCKNFALSKNANLSISINPFNLRDFNPEVLANTILKDIKVLKTLNVIFNLSFQTNDNIYSTLENYLNDIREIKQRNKHNNSTFVLYDEDEITLYGKVDGANKSTTFLTMEILNYFAQIMEKNLYFFNISKNKLSNNIVEFLLKNNFRILHSNGEYILQNIKNKAQPIVTNRLERNQNVFMGNILLKYSNIENQIDLHKCFCCDYPVYNNLIKAHIYRVADLDKLNDKDLARKLVISGDNGFLFCPNHDKEFEYGLIYFDLESKRFCVNKNKGLSGDILDFIGKRLTRNLIFENEFSQEFIYCVNEHIRRINKN